jgi:hypothetical protein
MICLAWAWAVLYNLSPAVLGWTEIQYKRGATQCGPKIPETIGQLMHSSANTLFNLIIPFSVMTVCYIWIFVAVRRHNQT